MSDTTRPQSQRRPSRFTAIVGTLIFALLLVPTSGCDKAKEALNKAKKAGKVAKKIAGKSGGTTTSPEGKAIAATSKKMNAYADCLNGFGRNIGTARTRYLSWADAKSGPTGKERHIYGLPKVSLDPESRCAAKVAKVASQTPSMPDLEAAAVRFVKELRTAHTVINQAHAYYKAKGYKGDAMAKGQTLHPKLMAAFEGFLAADLDLGRQFDRADDALAERRLAHLDATVGKKMRYRHLFMMRTAKRLFRASRTSKPLSLEDLDAAETKAAASAFNAAMADATRYASSHRKEFPTASSYSQVGTAAKDLAKSAQALLKRKADGKVFTGKETWLSSGNAKRQVGHPAHTTDKYNGLVDASNRLRL